MREEHVLVLVRANLGVMARRTGMAYHALDVLPVVRIQADAYGAIRDDLVVADRDRLRQ